MEQRTDDWFAARLGRVTASRVGDIMVKTKTGYGASRANYMADLIVERLTGKRIEGYVSRAMEFGTETEPEARSAYEFYTGQKVTQVGFVGHPTIDMAGASPDGLVGTDGLVEIKCPAPAQHIQTLLGDAIAIRYIYQMQWQMACTGRAWCDFVSYDPRMPEDMRFHMERVHRSYTFIADMEKEVRQFLDDLDSKLALLKKKFG